jgi:predicted ribosomally synthesized peptide with nif11-like leader
MSKEHAQKFHSKLETDAALRAEIRKARDSALEGVRAVGKKHGFEFTDHELHEVLNEKWSGRVAIGKTLDDKDDPNTCFFLSERPGE